MYMIETILDDSHFQDTSIIEDMYMPETRDEVNMNFMFIFQFSSGFAFCREWS